MVCPHSCGKQHVTLDIDIPFGQYRLLVDFGCMHTRKSAGGNTHYLICWNTNHDIKADTLFNIRKMLHDDPERIEADRARFIATGDIRFAEGILFDTKNQVESGVWNDL